MMADFRLSRPGDEPRLRSLWREAFGDPDSYLDLFFAGAYAPERCMVLEADGSLMGAAYWLRCELDGKPLAYVYAVAIDKSCRGLGFGRALMEALRVHLTETGFEAILLVPGDEGLRRFYRGLGYSDTSFHTRRTAEAGTPVEITALPASEYAALRRQYLPNRGVIQEDENLRLLSGMARFYRGDGFLAAVTAEGCPEFLGDESKLPGLAAALGFDALSCRFPGEETPYAMGLSLCAAPLGRLYFGFGFD